MTAEEHEAAARDLIARAWDYDAWQAERDEAATAWLARQEKVGENAWLMYTPFWYPDLEELRGKYLREAAQHLESAKLLRNARGSEET